MLQINGTLAELNGKMRLDHGDGYPVELLGKKIDEPWRVYMARVWQLDITYVLRVAVPIGNFYQNICTERGSKWKILGGKAIVVFPFSYAYNC